MDYQDDDLDQIPTRVMRVYRTVLGLLQAMAQEALYRPQVFLMPQSLVPPNAEIQANKSRTKRDRQHLLYLIYYG